MIPPRFALLLAILPGLLSCQPAGRLSSPALRTGAAAEDVLRRVDLEHARIAQSGDAAAMAAILHPAYVAHLTNGRLSSHGQTLAVVRSGSLAREKFERVQEAALVVGDSGYVMGLDRLDAPPPLADRGQLTRRYTNFYVREDGRWRLLARHFHLLP